MDRLTLDEKLYEIEVALRDIWNDQSGAVPHLLADSYLAAALNLVAREQPEPIRSRLRYILYLYISMDKGHEEENERPGDEPVEGVPGPPDG